VYEPVPCPLKEGLMCAATARLILEGRCVGCIYSARVLNDPWDAFGRSIGYGIETIARRSKA
jgi:hypothetical protein